MFEELEESKCDPRGVSKGEAGGVSRPVQVSQE